MHPHIHIAAVWLVTVAYPFLHAVVAPIFLATMPDPGDSKGTYAFIYTLVKRWAPVKQDGGK